jgi:hypothetical protein
VWQWHLLHTYFQRPIFRQWTHRSCWSYIKQINVWKADCSLFLIKCWKTLKSEKDPLWIYTFLLVKLAAVSSNHKLCLFSSVKCRGRIFLCFIVLHNVVAY